jgi:beta-RFAP synthase
MTTALASESRAVSGPAQRVGGVRVHAPARLHLGFLDPSGSLGRRFGSLGLMVDGFETQVELGHACADEFTAGPDGAAALALARHHVETLRRATLRDAPLALHLPRVLPAHAGLGSGTQLALAVGRAFCTLFGLGLPTSQLARVLGRGLRSGVGVAGFDQGGLLLDGGPRSDGSPAALLARIVLPPSWRILLVLDGRVQGLSGEHEKTALAALPPLPREAAAELCHEVLMRILPGAAGAEFAVFAGGLNRMQQLLGSHFAPAQAGRPYTSAAVGRLLDWIGTRSLAAIGQSSWGPTGFAILPSLEAAQASADAARAAGVVDPAVGIHIVGTRNQGATVARLPPAD